MNTFAKLIYHSATHGKILVNLLACMVTCKLNSAKKTVCNPKSCQKTCPYCLSTVISILTKLQTSTSLLSKLLSIAIIITPVLSGHFWCEKRLSSLFFLFCRKVFRCCTTHWNTSRNLQTVLKLFHGRATCTILSSCSFMASFPLSNQKSSVLSCNFM